MRGLGEDSGTKKYRATWGRARRAGIQSSKDESLKDFDTWDDYHYPSLPRRLVAKGKKGSQIQTECFAPGEDDWAKSIGALALRAWLWNGRIMLCYGYGYERLSTSTN
jgi:hypothetical protein